MENTPNYGTQTTPKPMPRKTVLGSYIIMRHIASGGMGSVWEGWLNPYAELGARMVKGEAEKLLPLAGVKSEGGALKEEDLRKIHDWVKERTWEFLENPDPKKFADTYAELLTYVAPHRRIAGDFRRAIKVLDENLSSTGRIVERFLKEMEILAMKLNHPNIVKVVEGGQAGKTYYAAMEYVDAISLDDTKLSAAQATHVIRQALEGLIHAHEQGILHRDIKPANLLVDRELKKVKLTDFGIAKALDETRDGRLTATGIIVGTPFYIDPERVRGENPARESDVYSLGATFYKLLTGAPPVQGTSPIDIMGMIGAREDPPWVRTKAPRVSEELEDVIMMMLAKEVPERLTTYQLRHLLKHLDENQLLTYQEPTEAQKREFARAAPWLARDVKRLKRDILRLPGPERAEAALRLCQRYEDTVELYSRADSKGVNSRIDVLEAALATVSLAVEAFPAEKVALLKKKLALEKRRLAKLGVPRLLPPPPTTRRRAVLIGTATLGVGLALWISVGIYQKVSASSAAKTHAVEARRLVGSRDMSGARIALDKAKEAARDLPGSSEAAELVREVDAALAENEEFDKVLADSEKLKRHVESGEFFEAAALAASLRESMDKLTQSRDERIRLGVRDLKAALRESFERLDRFAPDIKVHSGLMEVAAGLQKTCRKVRTELEQGTLPPGRGLEDAAEQAGQILAKLRQVKPEAIGGRYAKDVSRTEALLEEIRALEAQVAKRREAASAVSSVETFLTETDASTDSLGRRMRNFRSALENAESQVRALDPADAPLAKRLAGCRERWASLDRLVNRALSGEPAAIRELLKGFIQGGNLKAARLVLDSLTAASRPEDYVAIVECEEKLRRGDDRVLRAKLIAAYMSAGFDDKAQALIKKVGGKN